MWMGLKVPKKSPIFFEAGFIAEKFKVYMFKNARFSLLDRRYYLISYRFL